MRDSIHSIQVIARFICLLAMVGVAASEGEPFLRITSPAHGAIVRPGHKLMVKVTGDGNYVAVGVAGSGGAVLGLSEPPIGKPPWTISVEVPLDTR